MDDTASATDIAALGRTIRRCTAVLVLAVGVHLMGVAPGGNDWGLALVTLAGSYLFASLIYVDGESPETGGDETDDAGSDEGAKIRSGPGD